MKAVWISFVISFVPGFVSGGVLLAQSLAANNTNTTPAQPGWLKNFTIESFGYGPNTPQEYAFSPGYYAAMYNLQGLECPRCVLGPVVRPRFTLPPFGALATLKLHDGRIKLFAGVAGIEAWKPDGTFEPQGRALWTNTYGDAWLTQGQAAMSRSNLGAEGCSRYFTYLGLPLGHGL